MTSSNALVSLQHKNRKPFCFFACTLAALLLCVATASAQTASHAPGWVVLTIGDYRSLHAKAYPPDREPQAPPVDPTLTRGHYDLRLDSHLAARRASLPLDAFEDGRVREPI